MALLVEGGAMSVGNKLTNAKMLDFLKGKQIEKPNVKNSDHRAPLLMFFAALLGAREELNTQKLSKEVQQKARALVEEKLGSRPVPPLRVGRQKRLRRGSDEYEQGSASDQEIESSSSDSDSSSSSSSDSSSSDSGDDDFTKPIVLAPAEGGILDATHTHAHTHAHTHTHTHTTLFFFRVIARAQVSTRDSETIRMTREKKSTNHSQDGTSLWTHTSRPSTLLARGSTGS